MRKYTQEELIKYYNNGAILYNKLGDLHVVKSMGEHYVLPCVKRNGTFSFEHSDLWTIDTPQDNRIFEKIINCKKLRINRKSHLVGIQGDYKEVVIKKNVKNRLKKYKHYINLFKYKLKGIMK